MKTIRDYINIITEMNADGSDDSFNFMSPSDYDKLPKVDAHTPEMLPGIATRQGNTYIYQGRPFTIKPGSHRSDADMVKTDDGSTIWLNSETTGNKTFNVAYLK